MSQTQVTRTACDWCGTIGELVSEDAEATPDGWTWQTDNDRSEDLCPRCTKKRADAIDAVRKSAQEEIPF